MRSLANKLRLTGPHARKRRLALMAGAVALIVIPASLVGASDTFSDVSSSAFYHDAVNAVAEAGITAGCGGSKYCPNNAVTRGQMAVFLNKLGALGDDTVPVVDAISVNGHFIEGGFERDSADPADQTIAFTGGAQTECKTVTAGANEFGSYSITYQIISTPNNTTLPPEKVNVQIVDTDDTPDPNTEFQLCLGTVDGSNLLAGDYQLYYQFIVFIGQGIFGAGAQASGASAAPSRYGH